ncbi:MAG: hypothetical protein K8H75_04120 [Sulfuricella sp.]|nr:hypothetical protein [Sulfuricella sp.]
MKLAIISWIITAGFVYFVAGSSLEQGLLAAKVAFLGLILGFIAGKIGDFFEAGRNLRDFTRR